MKLYGPLNAERERMKVFRTDGATEFAAELEAFLESWNVHHEVGNLLDKPTIGARFERMVQLVGNGVHVILLRSGLLYRFWAYALATWCQNLDCTPLNPRSEKIPYEEYRCKPFKRTILSLRARVLALEHNATIAAEGWNDVQLEPDTALSTLERNGGVKR